MYGISRLHVATANALYDRILTQVTELTFVSKRKRARVRETIFWRRQEGEGWKALAHCPTFVSEQSRRPPHQKLALEVLTGISPAGWHHVGYSVYTTENQKEHTVHKLDCWRFFEFVIGAVDEPRPSHS